MSVASVSRLCAFAGAFAAEGKLDKSVAFNMASTNDIGGNSGSPVIEAKGDVVGWRN